MRQVHPEHPEVSVRHLCELLQVNRAWDYQRPLEIVEDANAIELRDASEQLSLEFPGYGYRRVTKALAREGWQVNHKRV
jgi:putative transposase